MKLKEFKILNINFSIPIDDDQCLDVLKYEKDDERLGHVKDANYGYVIYKEIPPTKSGRTREIINNVTLSKHILTDQSEGILVWKFYFENGHKVFSMTPLQWNFENGKYVKDL